MGAIGVFDLRAVAPVGVDGLGVGGRLDGDIRQQDEVAIQVGVVRAQRPQRPGLAGQAELEPADLDGDGAFAPGVLEGDLEAQAQRRRGDQGLQGHRLPAVEAAVVDLDDPVQMAGADDAFRLRLAHLPEQFLVV